MQQILSLAPGNPDPTTGNTEVRLPRTVGRQSDVALFL
jgi:hypothetical protein